MADPFAPSSDPDIPFLGVLLLLVSLVAGISSAFQQAGVLSMALAHLMMFFTWVGFVCGALLIEAGVEVPKRKRLKITVLAALGSLVVLGCVDGLMVYLKSQQSASASVAVATPSPSPSLSARMPAAVITPSVRAIESPTLSPTPVPQIISQSVRITPSSSPLAVPAGFTPKPESAQLAVSGGSAKNVLALMRKQADYIGPGSVLQFEVRNAPEAGGNLYFGGPNVSNKSGFGLEPYSTRYWATVDLSELYFYSETDITVAVTFVWLKEIKQP